MLLPDLLEILYGRLLDLPFLDNGQANASIFHFMFQGLKDANYSRGTGGNAASHHQLSDKLVELPLVLNQKW